MSKITIASITLHTSHCDQFQSGMTVEYIFDQEFHHE